MIGTEFIKGFGLGNQLFCYVVARCIAQERGCEFGTANSQQLGNVFHSQRGMYFMDIDLGREITPEMNFSVWGVVLYTIKANRRRRPGRGRW